jgi:hypothetical protein
MDKIRVPIVSGLGDIVPLSVIKGSGSKYAVTSKAAEYIKFKLALFDNLDIDSAVTKNQFIHTYCTYVPPSGKITRHELIYRILEFTDAYNNFRKLGITYRNPHDIANYVVNRGVNKSHILIPTLGDNPVFVYDDPIDLIKHEKEIITDCYNMESFLESMFYELKKQ